MLIVSPAKLKFNPQNMMVSLPILSRLLHMENPVSTPSGIIVSISSFQRFF